MAVVRRQRTSGDDLGPVLDLQNQCDDLRRERKASELDMISNTSWWQFKITADKDKP